METPRIADVARGLRHVFLHDMMLSTVIGVYPQERIGPQRLRINIDLGVEDDGARSLSRGPAVLEDELSRVVDYGKLAERVRALVETSRAKLLETLAERIAETCFADNRVQLVRIRVEKLDIIPDVGAAGVEIERRRR